MFPDIRKFGMTSEEFAIDLLNKEKVAVVPGNAFGDCGEGFIRISYAYSISELKEAVRRIENYIMGKHVTELYMLLWKNYINVFFYILEVRRMVTRA